MQCSGIEPLNPRFPFKSAFFQTVLSGSGPRRWALKRSYEQSEYEDEWLDIPTLDGTTLVAAVANGSSNIGTVIAIHGWEGAYDSAYMLALRQEVLAKGYRYIALHLRDHGPSHHLNEGVFNSSRLDEVGFAVKWLQQRHAAPNYLVGFSLGGNFSLRIAARYAGFGIDLHGVIAISPVISPKTTMMALSRPENLIYDQYFVRKWKKSLLKKQAFYPQYNFDQELRSLRTLTAMNEALIPRYCDFSSVDEYFKSYDISEGVLEELSIPCHIITSEDDPIIEPHQFDPLKACENLQLSLLPYGGHCGFLNGFKDHRWLSRQITRLLR